MSTARDRIEAKLGLTGRPLQPIRTGPPKIPDHVLVRPIGQGAYGEVWLARNALGTQRAIKIVYLDNFKDSRPYEREFAGIRRFEPLSRANEGFVDILQVGRDEPGGWFYYVMELADDARSQADPPHPPESPNPAPAPITSSPPNRPSDSETYRPRTLADELLRRGRLPLTECLELGLNLSLALAHLHRHGLIHRDVKPSNIIFVGGVPKLADIGLVTEAAGARTFVGTEGFVPPEGPTSPRADLYALGKVLYEAAMGKDRQQFPEPFTRIGTDPESIQLMELNAVLLRACEPKPEARYASAEEMHADLALLHSGGSVKRRHQFDRQFRAARRLGGAVGLVALLATGLYLWQAQQARRMATLADQSRANELVARENLYAADINLAQQALQADNLRQARTLLLNHIPSAGQPDLRGFEWRYLWQQAQGDEIDRLPGHPRGAWRAAFSPDGLQLATSGADDTVHLWDPRTGQPLGSLPGQKQVLSLSFAPGTRQLAAGSFQGVWLWDMLGFAKLRELTGATGPARFSPSGKYLLTSSPERLLLWSTDTWTVVGSMQRPQPRGWAFALAFAPEEDLFAVTVKEGVGLYTVPDLHLAHRIPRPPTARGLVSISPDGTLAFDGPGFGVTLWDIDRQRARAVLLGHTDHVYAARFAPDGRRVVTASADQTIRIWDTRTGALLNTLRGQADEVFDIAYSPRGDLLASVGMNDGSIKLWDPTARAKPSSRRGADRPVGFGPDGLLWTWTEDGDLRRLDPDTLELRDVAIDFPGRAPESTAFPGSLSADGQVLALWDQANGRMELWNVTSRLLLGALAAVTPWIRFAPGRGWALTETGSDTVTLWQLPSAESLCVFTNTSPGAACLSPDENYLLADEGGHPQLWNLQSAPPRREAALDPSQASIAGAAFSPDGRLLATAGKGAVIRLWSVPSGRELGRFTGHTRLVISLAFNPDGRTLASICDDRTVRLWHVASQRELMRFPTEREDRGPFALMFSQDGRFLSATRVDDLGPITWVWHAPVAALADSPPVAR